MPNRNQDRPDVAARRRDVLDDIAAKAAAVPRADHNGYPAPTAAEDQGDDDQDEATRLAAQAEAHKATFHRVVATERAARATPPTNPMQATAAYRCAAPDRDPLTR